MSLSILTTILGPLENNTYLLTDETNGECVIVDPSFNAARIVADARQRGLNLSQIWLTHAHFDHICGVPNLVEVAAPAPRIYLHPSDLDLYHKGGLADLFGMRFSPPDQSVEPLTHGQLLELGSSTIEVRHTPGHSPGHVVFHLKDQHTVLCGDLIFQGGVGRTDLEGGDQDVLFERIAAEIMTLPPETRLLSGHGGETTVGDELKWNPYLR
jgi:glyoxylase-like metal-dependent hydrolase (beta-lactamase superfamily II)